MSEVSRWKTIVSVMMNPKCETLLAEATKSQNDMSVYETFPGDISQALQI